MSNFYISKSINSMATLFVCPWAQIKFLHDTVTNAELQNPRDIPMVSYHVLRDDERPLLNVLSPNWNSWFACFNLPSPASDWTSPPQRTEGTRYFFNIVKRHKCHTYWKVNRIGKTKEDLEKTNILSFKNAKAFHRSIEKQEIYGIL